MTEFPSLSSSGPTTTIGGKSSSASCMEPSGLSSLRTVQGQDQGSVLGIITTVAEGAGGKSSRFTVSSETGPTTATAGKGSDSTAMEVDTLSVVAQQTVPGVDMGLVGRLLKGPELVGVSNAEEREGLLQRHVLEQQRLIESLLSALSVGQQGPMMTRRHVVVGLGLESGSSSSKSGGQEETSVAEDKNRGKN